MTLVLKPAGRGNWSATLVEITGKRASPLLFRVGQLLPLGGVTFRVCEVRA